MRSGEYENQVAYIAEMAAKLAVMAREVKLETLAHLLDMAALEAQRIQADGHPLDG